MPCDGWMYMNWEPQSEILTSELTVELAGWDNLPSFVDMIRQQVSIQYMSILHHQSDRWSGLGSALSGQIETV